MIKILARFFIILMLIISLCTDLHRMYKEEHQITYTTFDYGMNTICQVLMILGMLII